MLHHAAMYMAIGKIDVKLEFSYGYYVYIVFISLHTLTICYSYLYIDMCKAIYKDSLSLNMKCYWTVDGYYSYAICIAMYNTVKYKVHASTVTS